MAKSVDSIVKRYLDGMTSGAAKSKYLEGIEAVTESPMEKAAAADDLYLQRVEESVRSGKRAAKLRATPLSRWKDNAKKKVDRLASGATASADKVRGHFTKWTPIYEDISRTVQAMPKGSRQAAKDRVAKAIDMLMDAAGRQG